MGPGRPRTGKAFRAADPLLAMAIGYPQRDEGDGEPECAACGSLQLVLDTVGKSIRCKECGAAVQDPFAVT